MSRIDRCPIHSYLPQLAVERPAAGDHAEMRLRRLGLTLWETLFATATAAVFVALGIAMIWAGSALWHQHTEIVGRGIRVQGKMVGLERIGLDFDGERVDAGLVPVVRFATADGRMLTVRASGAPPYWLRRRSGEPVVVVYDPEHPADARIDELAGFWFLPLLFGLIGFAAVVIPPLTIWRHAHTASPFDEPPSGRSAGADTSSRDALRARMRH